MKQYIVTGMSCAACSARVEKAVGKVPGVESCSVSLLTNSMGVEGNVSPEDIIRAVADAGYGAELKKVMNQRKEGNSASEELLKDKETPILKKRLLSSLIFLAVLMYVSMGHMMWGWPIPKLLEQNFMLMGLLQMLLTIAVMVLNRRFL